jgi:hypothetical protein
MKKFTFEKTKKNYFFYIFTFWAFQVLISFFYVLKKKFSEHFVILEEEPSRFSELWWYGWSTYCVYWFVVLNDDLILSVMRYNYRESRYYTQHDYSNYITL